MHRASRGLMPSGFPDACRLALSCAVCGCSPGATAHCRTDPVRTAGPAGRISWSPAACPSMRRPVSASVFVLALSILAGCVSAPLRPEGQGLPWAAAARLRTSGRPDRPLLRLRDAVDGRGNRWSRRRPQAADGHAPAVSGVHACRPHRRLARCAGTGSVPGYRPRVALTSGRRAAPCRPQPRCHLGRTRRPTATGSAGDAVRCAPGSWAAPH